MKQDNDNGSSSKTHYCNQERRITRIETETQSLEKVVKEQFGVVRGELHNLTSEIKTLSMSIEGQRRYLLEMGIPEFKPTLSLHTQRLDKIEELAESAKNTNKWIITALSAATTAGAGIMLKMWEYMVSHH